MKNHLILGAFLSLLGAFFYAAQTALVKLFAHDMPPLPVVIFVQSAIALIFMLPLIFRKGFRGSHKRLATKRLPLHILRALFSLGISFLLFYAVTVIPLVNAMLLVNTSPLIVPFVSYIFLGEKMNHRLWIPVLIAFAGVACVLHPHGNLFNPAMLLALGAAICMSVTLLSVRKLSHTDSSETISFWFFLLSTLISGIIALFFLKPISLFALGVMSLIGLLYFLTQYTMANALKYANAQIVGALFYATIIYATFFSVFINHIIPDSLTKYGIILVMTGGIMCILTERRSQRKIHLGD